MAPLRHRRCLALRGARSETRAAALDHLSQWTERDILWIGDPNEQQRFAALSPARVVTALGRSLHAVVLDAHDGLDPDVLGQCHGLVWGGGALLLRLPPPGAGPSPATQASLAAYPHTPEEVGARFHVLLERALARAELATTLGPPPPLRDVSGHAEQAEVVARLVAAWSSPTPTRIALLADRGRGKSSALGLALRQLGGAREVAVTAAGPTAALEVLRHARGASDPVSSSTFQFTPLAELVLAPRGRPAVIVVDEAAQLPVPMLRRLVERHPGAHLAFATTTHGYEGTGRGFSLRFLSWLSRQEIAVTRLQLSRPIRWDPGDPLERLVFDALLLDAEPAAPPAIEVGEAPLVATRLDRDALVDDEETLRALFGLLVHAHYRTTPGDLRRLLDAPNLELHALRRGAQVVAATALAREGGLPATLIADALTGATRLRAHALADSLIAHLGKPAAGSLQMIRSVRIAVHPALRRRGLATRLVEHVHEAHAPALFGTLFGATPELLAFRRQLGYEVVRLSASRGARTGEPSVMMLRAVSAPARALVAELRAELARDLPRQLELLQADGETLLDPTLAQALQAGLPPPAPLSPAQCHALARAYAHGPRTVESVALALARFVAAHPAELAQLAARERALVEARVLAGRGWREAAAAAELPSVPAAMRGLRRTIRRLVALVERTDLSI